jgi:hypothetical protein
MRRGELCFLYEGDLLKLRLDSSSGKQARRHPIVFAVRDHWM